MNKQERIQAIERILTTWKSKDRSIPVGDIPKGIAIDIEEYVSDEIEKGKEAILKQRAFGKSFIGKTEEDIRKLMKEVITINDDPDCRAN